MIHYIKGKLAHVDSDWIVIESGNIGYRVATSATSIADLNQGKDEVIVHTEMIVREDAISLVGFSSPEELKMFQLLTSVSGVGTKVGVGILSSMSYKALANAICENDVKKLTSAQGVGKKTAERIVLELKDKVSIFTDQMLLNEETDIGTSYNQDNDDALLALVSLGYTRNEALSVLKRLDVSTMSTEEILKRALKELMTQ